MTPEQTAAETDPIDALDLSDVAESGTVDTDEPEIPESMILGGKRDTAPADDTDEEAEDDEAEPEKGQPRDEKGKFAKKAAADAAAREQSADGAASAAGKTPFQYRAMGANHALEGAALDVEGNLTIPAAQTGTIRQALNALHLAQSGEGGPTAVIQERDAQITELSQRIKEHEYLGTVAEGLIGRMDAICKEPDDEKALMAFWKLRQGWAAEMAQAEGNYWKMKAEHGATQPDRANGARSARALADDSTAQAAGMPSTDDALATTMEYIEHAKLDGRFKALTDTDWKQFVTQMQRTPYTFLRQATAEEARQYGPIVFDIDAFVDHLGSLTKAKATTAKKTGLAAANARRTQPSVATPPNASGGGKPVGAGKGKGFSSAEDVENWLNSDEL